MNGTFYIAATGLDAQQRALEVVANNISNLNTSAFKRSDVRFQALVAPQSASDGDSTRANGVQLQGVRLGDSQIVMAQGDMRQTSSPMDVAIQGDGLIELMGPNGKVELWRGGTLSINADGLLAGPDGAPLKGAIQAPGAGESLVITADGRVSKIANGQTVQIGQLSLSTVKDPASLIPISNGIFQLSQDAVMETETPGKDGFGQVIQGSLELSNVQLADEMVALLSLQRAYAANAQVVQAGDQLASISNDLKK